MWWSLIGLAALCGWLAMADEGHTRRLVLRQLSFARACEDIAKMKVAVMTPEGWRMRTPDDSPAWRMADRHRLAAWNLRRTV